MLKNFCRLIIFMIVGIFLLNSTVQAEVEIFEGVGEYMMTEFEMAGTAKQRAKFYAVRNAQEKAGIYIKSHSKSVNSTLTEDEIIAISAGIVQILDVKIVSVPSDDGVTFQAKVKVNIDTDRIDDWLERDPKERERLINENKELQKSISEQEEQIAYLKKLIAEAKTPEDIERIKAGFAKIDGEFLSNQKHEEGQQLYKFKDYANAIKSYNQAIELNPNNALAYKDRGEVHYDLKNYSQAISDYSKAINLKPNYAMVYVLYNNRGNAYAELKEYNKAIADYNKTLAINPNLAATYNNRGTAYYNLGNYNQAIADYTKAIQFDPNLSDAYYNRGISYEKLGNIAKANADFAKAKSLGMTF